LRKYYVVHHFEMISILRGAGGRVCVLAGAFTIDHLGKF
jgi:hypothetical protein